MSLYRGFSTVNQLSQKKFRLTDTELIKQDLLNALNTPLGSRLMLPREGCIVWELLYEPFTPEVQEQISNNLYDIVSRDPRITIQSLNLIPDEDQNSITMEINLLYTNTNQLEQLIVQFDEQFSAQII
jgi:phage baseplate assembly protein W